MRYIWHQALGYFLISTIGLWLFLSTQTPLRWQISFGALQLTFVLQCIAYGLGIGVIFGLFPSILFFEELPAWCMLASTLACTAIILVSVAIDLRTDTPRDWLHRCGLSVALLLALMEWFRFWRPAITQFFE